MERLAHYVSVIRSHEVDEFREDLNEELGRIEGLIEKFEIKDIKFSTCIDNGRTYYSALIIYTCPESVIENL